MDKGAESLEEKLMGGDRLLGVAIVAVLLSSLTAAGALVGRLHALTGFMLLLVAQFVSAPYAVSLVVGGRSASTGDRADSLAFRIGALLVLPFFYQGAYRVFGSRAFFLNGESGSLWDWALYAFDQVADSVFVGIPALYGLSLSSITHRAPYGATILLATRVLVIGLFLGFAVEIYRARRTEHQ